MRRRLLLPFLLFTLLLPAGADSYSLSAFISGVSNGPDSFGYNLFPLGTTFGFEKFFPIIDGLKDAEFQIEMNMAFNEAVISELYDWKTGRPKWSMTKEEEAEYEFLRGTYLYPRAYIDVYLDQGFWTNPLYPDGTLFNVKLGFNSFYSAAVERLGLSRPGDNGLPVFTDWEGNLRYPYTETIPAFPWLQGSRNVLSNFIYLDLYLNLDRDTPTDAEPEHGFYMEFLLQYGPWWLANNLVNGKQSDYLRMVLYAEEKLELFSIQQENGWNWVNMYFGHSNTLQYIAGDIVPQHMIPEDRLRGYISDRIWLHFTGPQFMAGDCFTFIELNLYNTIRFGGVVNEPGNVTHAVELQSSFTAVVQVRLFGFIRLEYQVGYDFIRGIWAEKPRWWQNAALSFYVSV